jgi:hypothetical protein
MITFDSEEKLELCLMDNPEWLIDNLGCEEGSEFFRQVEIPPYGRTDIIGIKVDGERLSIKVIELKNRTITLSDIGQLARYLKYFHVIRPKLPFKKVIVEGSLLGPVDFSGDDVFVAQSVTDIDVYHLEIDPMHGLEAIHIDGYVRATKITNYSPISTLLGVEL